MSYGTDIHRSQPPHIRHNVLSSPSPSSVISSRGTEYLEPISNRMVTVSPTTGKTIADALDVFHDIDPDYHEWRLNVPGKPTKRHRVLPLRQKKDGTLPDMFFSIGSTQELLQIALEQEQITNYVREWSDLMSKDGFATFFLMRKGDELIIASVFEKEGRRKINFRRLSSETIKWLAEEGRQVVVRIF